MAARPVSFSFSVWKTLFSVVSLVLLFDHVSALTIRTELQKPIGSSSGTEIRPKQLPSLPVGRTALRRPLGATTASIEQAEQQEEPRFLDEKQLDFTLGYLNKHHEVMLTKFAEVFSPLGAEKAKKNAWSGGSFKILSATIVSIDTQILELDVEVQERKMGSKTKRVEIELDAVPVVKSRKFGTSARQPPPPIPNDLNLLPIDDIVRRLCRLCWMVDEAGTTGKLFQLAIQLGGSDIGKIKENMFLNQCPHNRYVRKYFYEMASNAVLESVLLCSQGRISNRMKITPMFPEMNPSMDSYRIGTILEMIRVITIKLVEQNLRVRVCVQGSMGVGIFTGVPKQLNGVTKLLQLMDWQSEKGEENEGMVGDYLNFGNIGAQHVVNAHIREDGTKVEQDDVFILIAPQSMVGVDSSIYESLKEMTEAAGDRPIILLNPDLTDKVSAQGQQNVRGRQDRLDFANSFQTIWHFQNIYVSGTSYFPILGATFKPGPLKMWSIYQRRDLANDEGEVYIPTLAGEGKPQGDQILESFQN
mmetsp:Transcript_24289/g.53485  ORF Transcript_24289/g.53485 Transcript_24289/m.53485 type:complete len:530 (+) Transcript_24289:138-1727(+)|eukprot:CAMPEP_0201120812 /NCGR_PEP_ID=MMETSP0850-20130426/4815_1 /ASSEMBLY_ACC=CAM_ASM_000622 /TAXON_ID=183588 /ORGANISM="Pseudo-nitzschia fraudulenta, Strain WWA7" /LENGTH=529 /DNA_ID=CAMNT_0047387083 /DNA_START=99 /DNA_END=1688 /DNA_ORIENTATION=+